MTSYYPDADVQYLEAYEYKLPKNKMKGYYAYQEKPFWFPMKTFKEVENDPLNDLSNIFSKLTDNETAIIQVLVRPKSDKWTKKLQK